MLFAPGCWQVLINCRQIRTICSESSSCLLSVSLFDLLDLCFSSTFKVLSSKAFT